MFNVINVNFICFGNPHIPVMLLFRGANFKRSTCPFEKQINCLTCFVNIRFMFDHMCITFINICRYLSIYGTVYGTDYIVYIMY